jgi:hypothetical protein
MREKLLDLDDADKVAAAVTIPTEEVKERAKPNYSSILANRDQRNAEAV